MSYCRTNRKHLAAAALASSLLGCSVSDIVGRSDPTTGAGNPDAVKSVSGAINFSRGAIELFGRAVALYVRTSGLLTDELRTAPTMSGATYSSMEDLRVLPEQQSGSLNAERLFSHLNNARIHALDARRVIRTYAPGIIAEYLGHMYAIEGMSTLYLADIFCSGIPLSTFDDHRNYIFSGPVSTQQTYERAIAFFDSALAVAPDTGRVRDFAITGKARALLALGRYGEAATTAAQVSNTSFRYLLEYRSRPMSSVANGFKRNTASSAWNDVTVSDSEGNNGLPFASAGDPRVQLLSGFTQPTPTDPLPYPRYVATKYADINGNDPIMISSGIEAKLIVAEDALHRNDVTEWLTTLNALRTSCTDGATCPTPAPAGLGGVTGLGLLTDPGAGTLPPGKTAQEVRVDLMFRERAFWLFLTGHRQGDLRRLVRQYGRPTNQTYPVGSYPFARPGSPSVYGNDVTFPIPWDERNANPKFTGCIDREA
jgi:tetratricopeptide (TPR) repeat protein